MVRQFKDDDYDQIKNWYDLHDLTPPQLGDYPSYGLIEPGIACGFIILTDARIGILDFYITNPIARPIERDKSLDEITVGLMDYGTKFGLKYFKCDTEITNIGRRALKHGFKFVGKFSSYFRKR